MLLYIEGIGLFSYTSGGYIPYEGSQVTLDRFKVSEDAKEFDMKLKICTQ